jgi:hypothetical protein
MAAYTSYVTLRDVTVRATQPYDFVLSPTSPILPYEAELPSPNNDPRNALPHIAFTVPYNMSEQPAASLNWTFSKDSCRSACRSAAAASTISACCASFARWSNCARRSRPGLPSEGKNNYGADRPHNSA